VVCIEDPRERNSEAGGPEVIRLPCRLVRRAA
jgi:hypothetical protein